MLNKEDNELLTRVGPRTPMGELLRQYWLPVLLSSELSDPDGAPLRTRLLGEALIAFRDSQGRVGLLADHCSHRGASLFYGRNEEGGLRCVYHGWKYDVAGNCMDMPNEPESGSGMPDPYQPGPVGAGHALPFKDKIHHIAYPCAERNGVIWAYMGPRHESPPLPDLEWNMVPEAQARASKTLRECNWMQALEGDIDTSHLGFLHMRLNQGDNPALGHYHTDKHPYLELVPTDYGVRYGARRDMGNGSYYWRVTHFLMPFHTFFPPRGYPWVPGHMWIPIDDRNTMVWSVTCNPEQPVTNQERTRWAAGGDPYQPPTTDALGRWRLVANKRNDYLRDYEVQRTQTFTGIPSITLQDQAVTESMGEIFDRSQEHLGSTDAVIIQVRRRLLEAARALRDHGVTPGGVDNPEWYRVRSASLLLPAEVDWIEGSKEVLRAFSGLPVASALEEGR